MKTILVLTDFSQKATHASEYAFHIAKKVKANLLLYNEFVISEHAPVTAKFIWALEEFLTIQDNRKKRLKELANHLELKNGKCTGTEFKPSISCMSKEGQFGNLGRNLNEITESKDICMIVMGTKGDDCLSNFIFGTNAYSVISQAVCPVIFVPRQASIKTLRRVALVADAKDQNLLPVLKELKETLNPEIVLAHVCTCHPVHTGRTKELIEDNLYNADSGKENRRLWFTNINGDEMEEDLSSHAFKAKTDMLAIVHRKENVFHRIFHSNTTKLLIDHAHIPLLVLPVSDKRNLN